MTNAHTPAPFSSPECDVRDLPCMPLKVVDLRESDFVALSTGDEFKAALMLWTASWLETPAGSLRNDDRWLASKAKVDPVTWERVKAMALYGWTLCDDGRLYHRVVADLAMDKLPGHLAFQDKRSGDAARKQRERDERKALFAEAKDFGLPVSYRTGTTELRSMVAEAKAKRDASRVTSHTQERDQLRDHDCDASHDAAVTSGVTDHVTVTARKGRRIEDSPQPPMGGGRDKFDQAWGIIPDKCRAPADRPRAERAWASIVQSGEATEDELLSAVRMMVEAFARSNGAMAVKAFHRWLEIGRWRNWPLAGPSATSSRWTGPADIRAAIVAHVAEARGSVKDAEDLSLIHI